MDGSIQGGGAGELQNSPLFQKMQAKAEAEEAKTAESQQPGAETAIPKGEMNGRSVTSTPKVDYDVNRLVNVLSSVFDGAPLAPRREVHKTGKDAVFEALGDVFGKEKITKTSDDAVKPRRNLLKRLSDKIKKYTKNRISFKRSSKEFEQIEVSSPRTQPPGVRGQQGTPIQRFIRASNPISDMTTLLRKQDNQELAGNLTLRDGVIRDMASAHKGVPLGEALAETAKVSEDLGALLKSLNTLDLSKLYDGHQVKKGAYKELSPDQMKHLSASLSKLNKLEKTIRSLENDPRFPKDSEESHVPGAIGDTVSRLKKEINQLILPPKL